MDSSLEKGWWQIFKAEKKEEELEIQMCSAQNVYQLTLAPSFGALIWGLAEADTNFECFGDTGGEGGEGVSLWMGG